MKSLSLSVSGMGRPFVCNVLPASGFKAACLCALVGGAGQLARADQVNDLAWLDLEALGKIEVVSVARRETALATTAAAITVVRDAEIERSAATSLPQLLRLVPGVDVSQVGSTTWGVGIRGFGSEQSNKLLMMVDNRSLYNPVFAGTAWSAENFLLQDIERIEVVRGPGGAAWGANAVNGVVNVVNKSAAETQGGLLSVSLGNLPGAVVAARYGWRAGSQTAVRVYAKRDDIGSARTPEGGSAEDGVLNTRCGFRADWTPSSAAQVSVSGEYYVVHRDQKMFHASLTEPTGLSLVEQSEEYKGGFVRSRLNCDLATGGRFTTQLSVDKGRSDNALFANDLLIADWDAQYSQLVGQRNQLTGGVGYRLTKDDALAGRSLTFDPQSAANSLFSAFLQDEGTLLPDRLSTLTGVRVEHHEVAGWDVQPTFRLLYTPGRGQSLWAGASRAVRIPSRVPTQGMLGAKVYPAGTLASLPVLVELRGDPGLANEVLWSYELGYRVQPLATLAVEANLFHNEYKNLIQEVVHKEGLHYVAGPGPAHLVLPAVYSNSRDARSDGGELALTWRPASHWSVTGHCSYAEIVLLRKPEGTGLERDEGYTPKWIAGLRSTLDFARGWQFSADLRRSGSRPAMPLPAYVELELKLSWRPCPRLELSAVGQNLLHAQHAEAYPLTANLRPREIQRSGYGQVTWFF